MGFSETDLLKLRIGYRVVSYNRRLQTIAMEGNINKGGGGIFREQR